MQGGKWGRRRITRTRGSKNSGSVGAFDDRVLDWRDVRGRRMNDIVNDFRFRPGRAKAPRVRRRTKHGGAVTHRLRCRCEPQRAGPRSDGRSPLALSWVRPMPGHVLAIKRSSSAESASICSGRRYPASDIRIAIFPSAAMALQRPQPLQRWPLEMRDRIGEDGLKAFFRSLRECIRAPRLRKRQAWHRPWPKALLTDCLRLSRVGKSLDHACHDALCR